MGYKLDPSGNMAESWEATLKPEVMKYRRVPLEVAADVLGFSSIDPVKAMLVSGMYSFGCARPGSDGNIYEIYPMRFCAWVEGRLP